MPHDVDALNAGFAGQLLEQYLENPASVPEEWRTLFEQGDDAELLALQPGLVRLLEQRSNGAPAPSETVSQAPVAAEPQVDEELLGGVAAAMALVKAYRMHGHLAARLDPLGSEPPGDPALEPGRMVPKLTPELQARIPARLLRTYVEGETLAEALPRLQETYCGTIAYEIEHISDHEERVWLREAIESGRYRATLSDDEERALLTRLTEVEGLETYLRKAFLGQKQFSIEGLDVLVPMLDESIHLAADAGAHEVVLGMAHRGRLNVLAHVIGRPYETILREFEGERMLEAVSADSEGGTGDVKYHLGAQGRRVDGERRDQRHARREPEPPRGRRPRRRGTDARRPDRPLDARGPARPLRRAARSSSTATRRFPRRVSSPRRSISPTWTATRPAARST